MKVIAVITDDEVTVCEVGSTDEIIFRKDDGAHRSLVKFALSRVVGDRHAYRCAVDEFGVTAVHAALESYGIN